MAARDEVKVGDRVGFAAEWLRSTGQYTGPIPFARGIVESVRDLGGIRLARVRWDDPAAPGSVLLANLARVGSDRF